ncbi:biopolymer transport protein ExbD/TolR [Thermosulfidibacter takaii ABI70S6]|uniref:Biopolymer transport protein ExbD/TolR n=1 Tax=Thermosulfidibacter takaii (strain DSM 17441 / JCM 13301 / NBRC 103674 / ABI70S6) TaxID=1298851 RepID=A0A0S3QRY2_THET7|nr:biopolymer transporter ExbD [Thermosulfidibacter takaii]BAT71098.1 biopolymer transport protein ExbD/TolR [Thermosulfidibacter takaii ABI70S6]
MRFLREEEEPGISLVSMTDVVFLLLIFFMVATQFVSTTKRLDIKLPQSKAGTSAPLKKSYEIDITKDGKIYLNGKKVTLTQLDLILQADRNIPERSALIKADRRIPYGFAIKVMGILKANGVENIGIAVLKQ